MVTFDELVAEMDSAGVDRSIVCGFPGRASTCAVTTTTT